MRFPSSFPSPSRRGGGGIALVETLRFLGIGLLCQRKRCLILQGTDARRARRKDARRDISNCTPSEARSKNVCAEPHLFESDSGQTADFESPSISGKSSNLSIFFV